MVCGSLPFNARSIPALIKKIVEGRFKLPKFLTPQVQHLIQSILQIAPENRPTLKAILDHPWMRLHREGGSLGGGGGAQHFSQASKPVSRPEVISPQSYTNARAAELLARSHATHPLPSGASGSGSGSRNGTMGGRRSGYNTVNANERSVVRIDDSDDDDDGDGGLSQRTRDGALDEGEEGQEDDDFEPDEHDDDEDDEAGNGGRDIIRKNTAGEPVLRNTTTKPLSPGPAASEISNTLPPSSVLSFQPESSSHLLERDASFSRSSGGESTTTSSAAQPIPSGMSASEAAGALEFAASPAANWGGTLKKVKPVNCPRCGKLLSARTAQSGAIVLAGTSVSAKASGLGASLAKQAEAALLELCQCAPASTTTATNGDVVPPPAGVGQQHHTVRFSSESVDDGSSSTHDPSRATPIQPLLSPASSPHGGANGRNSSDSANAKYFPATPSTPTPSISFRETHFSPFPVVPPPAAPSTSGGGSHRKKSSAGSLSSVSRPLTAEEIADREKAYREKVARLFQAAEKGEAPVLAKLISHDDDEGSSSDSHPISPTTPSAAIPSSPSASAAAGAANASSPSASAAAAPSPPAWTLPPIDVRVTTIDSWNALHFAARNGHAECVSLLLTCWQPLNIDCRTKSGWTPLMLAADKGHLDACLLLLRYGAAIHVTNNDGKSAIFLARESGHPQIAQALTHASSLRTKKHTEGASARNNTSTNPENGEQTKELNHQLLQAAECGDLAKVKHLLQLGRTSSGGNTNVSSPSRSSIAAAAAAADATGRASPAHPGSASVSSARRGSPADQSSSDALSPRYCVDIRARGIDNWSVLHFAARKGRTAVVACLLDQDPPAEINALTKKHWTPLMLAADRGHKDTCVLLLARGADPGVTSMDKYTALSAAQEGGHHEIVALLSGHALAAELASGASFTSQPLSSSLIQSALPPAQPQQQSGLGAGLQKARIVTPVQSPGGAQR